MSLANYLDAQKVITADQIILTQEPNDFDDGARISDTVVYLGNATYSLSPATTTIIGPNADWTPLFFDASGLNPPFVDYLNIRPQVDLFNFQQLANMTYKVFVNSQSSFDFSYRIAVYDASLNFIQAYDAINYDPSNNTRDPPKIDGITLQGWSVQIPRTAFYAFMEVKNNTTGSIEFQFDLGNSNLENAIDNSVENNLLGSRPSTNIFTSDYYVSIRDASGVEKDLATLEAEVAALQATTATQQNEITDISNNYLPLTGGTMTGTLEITGVNSYLIAEHISAVDDYIIVNNGGRLTNNNEIFYIESGDTVNFPNQPIIRFSEWDSGVKVIDIDTANKILDTDAVAIKTANYSNLDTQVKANQTQITTNTSNISANTSAIASKLSLTGGTMTGSINLGGTNRITNSAAPVGVADLTNKQYVDNAVATASGSIPSNYSRAIVNNWDGATISSTDINNPSVITTYQFNTPSIFKSGDNFSLNITFPQMIFKSGGAGSQPPTQLYYGIRYKFSTASSWFYSWIGSSLSTDSVNYQMATNPTLLASLSITGAVPPVIQVQPVAYLSASTYNWTVHNSLYVPYGLPANAIFTKSTII